MPTKLNLLGQRFGRLVVLRQTADRGKGTVWECQCDCGLTLTVKAGPLRTGHTKSCGCLVRERVRTLHTFHKNVVIHGGARKGNDGSYRIWRLMFLRCENPDNISYPLYGARGISVCERWRSFPAFREDMGPRPPGLTLERVDNEGDYTPENCVWATLSQQARNKRNTVLMTYLGRTQSLRDWADELEVSFNSLYYNFRKRGASPEAAVAKAVAYAETRATK